MPARWSKPQCRYFFTLLAVVLFVPAGVVAQTGNNSVVIRTTVSKAVMLSVPPNTNRGDVDVDVMSSGGTVRLTLSGKDDGPQVVQVPLLVRSNIGFSLSANVESQTAKVNQLSVMNVRATGRAVSPDAVTGVEVRPQFDRRGSHVPSDEDLPNPAGPFVVLTGSRVSLGGTIYSSNNALQITLLVRVKPESAGAWVVHLTLTGTPQ